MIVVLANITHNGTGSATFNNPIGVPEVNVGWLAASGPMTFNGAITGTNSVAIRAPEPITFDGSAVNTLSGPVVAAEGTLILSKSSTDGAIAGNQSINALSGGTAKGRWGLT